MQARDEIRASWRRVQAGGLEPAGAPDVAPLVETELESRRAASPLAPLLPRIRACLSPVVDDGQLVVVTDTDGRVLWQHGRGVVRRSADRLGFVPGSDWTEVNVGTNAIGTCLVTQEPVRVRGEEHYVEAHAAWGCAAAPVHDPWTGEVLGVVDVSGPARGTAASMLALVDTTVRLAEAEVRAEHHQRLDRLRAHAAPVLARLEGRALAVDPSGHVAAVTGLEVPARLRLPADLSTDSTWLPTLGEVAVEPLPGGWLVRLGESADLGGASVVLDLSGPRPAAQVSTSSNAWTQTLTRRHAELLLALIGAPQGRTAGQLADDLFADPTRVVTVRAEMSRLRRTFGSLLESQPYRLAARASVVAGSALSGSSAPVVTRR